MAYIQIQSRFDNVCKVITLTEQEHAAIKQAIRCLQTTMSEIDYCLMIRDNVLDAFKDLSTNGIRSEKNFNRLNRFFMNWLNSFYAWVEFHEKNYKQVFSNLKQQYFNTYFEYRFAYAMRNYTTHQSICITRIVYDLLEEKTRYEIPIDEIVDNADNLNHKVRNELKTRLAEDDSINVEEFTKRFCFMIEQFQAELWKAILPEAESSLSRLRECIDKYSSPDTISFLFKEENNKAIDIRVIAYSYEKKKEYLPIPNELQGILMGVK